MAAARAAQIRVALANLIPLFPTRSGGLKDEMPLQAIVFCASHHRAEKDGFEFTAVVGEVTVRLAKDRNDLRHLEPELAVLIGERGPVTLRLVLLPFGRVRPNLDALPSKRSAVACAAYGATHPEATLADPIHDRRALAVVVRPARHRLGRREALRAGGQQEPGNPGCPDGAASGEKVAAVEYDSGHVNSSCDRAVAPPRGRQQARDALNLARLRPIFQLREAKRLLLAIVRSQISATPSADSAAAAALDVAQNFFSLEAINRKLPRMMTGPVAFTLSKTIDKQPANAV